VSTGARTEIQTGVVLVGCIVFLFPWYLVDKSFGGTIHRFIGLPRPPTSPRYVESDNQAFKGHIMYRSFDYWYFIKLQRISHSHCDYQGRHGDESRYTRVGGQLICKCGSCG
jgi:hypothetical protein